VTSSRWFLGKTIPEASARLVLLPHAGGSAATFREWLTAGNSLEVLAVRYPGRAERLAEDPPQSLRDLAADLAEAVSELNPLPFVLFGHSMGALIAFETCRRLAELRRRTPEALFAAGCAAPHIARQPIPDHLSDDSLIDLLRSDGADTSALADDEMRELVMPSVRADLLATSRYRPPQGARLVVPIIVSSGEDDDALEPEHLTSWQLHTEASCDWYRFTGGHFFLDEHRIELLNLIKRTLSVQAGCPS